MRPTKEQLERFRSFGDPPEYAYLQYIVRKKLVGKNTPWMKGYSIVYDACIPLCDNYKELCRQWLKEAEHELETYRIMKRDEDYILCNYTYYVIEAKTVPPEQEMNRVQFLKYLQKQ